MAMKTNLARRTSQARKEIKRHAAPPANQPGPGPRCIEPKRRGAAPIRYCARAFKDSKIVELAVGENLTRVLGRARSHHQRSGQHVWVWSIRSGETVFEIGAVAIRSACA
jgi:hypothetical protein